MDVVGLGRCTDRLYVESKKMADEYATTLNLHLAAMTEEVTDTLERIAHKPKSYTYIAFDELPDENWAIAGKLLDQ